MLSKLKEKVIVFLRIVYCSSTLYGAR